MLLASAGGSPVPAITQLVRADVLAAQRRERADIRLRTNDHIRWGGRPPRLAA